MFWRNSKSDENDFKEYEKNRKKCEGPVWRLSWSFGGNLLAVSTAGVNGDNVVDVYKVKIMI